MRVLIISRTPWDNSNSFGNTFTNLFEGIENIKIYNICCQSGRVNNSVVEKVYRMSETMLIKGFLNKHTGTIVNKDQFAGSAVEEKDFSVIKKAGVKRTNIAFIIRDLIWKTGIWKKEKALNDFIEEANPDIIYLPIYASWYMCDVQQYFIKRTEAKVVGHISDDVYSYPKGYLCSPLTLFYRWILRAKLRKLISHTEYLEVFAENMKEEYERIFGKECFLIGKGVTRAEINAIPSYVKRVMNNEPTRIVYTGNIGGERFSILSQLGKVIDADFKGKVVVDVYTQTVLPKKDLKTLECIESINMCGSVFAEQVKQVQRNADILLHMEGFSKKSVCETRMSFSTKIIDYMLAGVPILAIGPNDINSIAFLKKNGLATVVTDCKDIKNCIENLICENIDFNMQLNSIKYILSSERNISVIQEGIHKRLLSLNRIKVL